MIGVGNSVRSKVQICTPAIYDNVMNMTKVTRLCRDLAVALEKKNNGEITAEEYERTKREKKSQLPIFTYLAVYKDGVRKAENATPTGLNNMDYDHVDARELYEEKIKGREEELHIVLVHVTPSGEGLRVVFANPEGLDIAEGQYWMDSKLGIGGYDEKVKDLARPSFAAPADYTLYINKVELLCEEVVSQQISAEEMSAVKAHFAEQAKATADVTAAKANAAVADGTTENIQYPMDYRGIPFSTIIEHYWELTGGHPQQGERNDRMFQLVKELRYFTDNNAEWMFQIVDSLGLDEDEVRKTIEQGLKYNNGHTTYKLKKAIKLAADECGIDLAQVAKKEPLDTPPPMPAKLPRSVDILTEKTPDLAKPAVARAMLSAGAAYLDHVKFEYIDNIPHEATLMSILVAESGAGKSAVKYVLDYLLADMKARDERSEARLAEWKRENRRRGAMAQKLPKPDNVEVQIINGDITHAAFVDAMAEANGKFLYLYVDEIEAFDVLGSRKVSTIFRIAFDTGDYGQTRVMAESVNAKVKLRFNNHANTTPDKLLEFFDGHCTDGTLQRFYISTIVTDEKFPEIPVYKKYDEKFAAKIKPLVDNLKSVHHCTVKCRQIQQLGKKMSDMVREIAQENDDKTYFELSHRAVVIAWLMAYVIYIMNGCKWEKAIEDFCIWSLQYDLWCKLEYFGDILDKANAAPRRAKRKKPGVVGFLAQMPQEFTLLEYIKARNMTDASAEQLRQLRNNIAKWKCEGKIEEIAPEKYKKLS